MTIDIDKLEALARAATPGPWHVGAYGGIFEGLPGKNGPGVASCHYRDYTMRPNGNANEAYIAAADPEATLALVARLRQAEAERDALAAHVKRLESALEAARDAVASLDIDALGSVPETHDCPAYPIRDAVTNDLTVAINRKPATSLARLKAQWQTEALQELYDTWKGEGMMRVGALLDKAIEIQEEAEEGEI